MFVEDIEDVPETKIRYLSAYQVLPEGKARIIPLSDTLTLGRITIKSKLESFLQRKADGILRDGRYTWGKPVDLALEVDGEVRVWRFGDKATPIPYRKLKEVTDKVPSKVLEMLGHTVKLLDLEEKKLEIMKQLIPATLAHYYKEVPDVGRDHSGCDQEG